MRTLDSLRQILNNPQQIALDWKAKGKKVLGYYCLYVPQEIIYAAGILPYPLFGTPEPITLADSYLPSNICEFVRNILDRALRGDFKFLDGFVVCNTCDATLKLFDHWKAYVKTPFNYIMNNPQIMNTELGYKFYSQELAKFKAAIEGFVGTRLNDETLQKAIDESSETRTLLRQLNSFRKETPPRISGVEALDAAMATSYLPRARANQMLRQLINDVEDRKSHPRSSGPRIIITGSIIDNPTLIKLIEEVGGTVVADDFCTSIRSWWHEVKNSARPLDALCHYGSERCVCACMHPSTARLEYLCELVEHFSANAIVYLNLKYCDPFSYEAVLFRDKLKDRGIPMMVLETEHSLSGLGPMRTRLQAFIEML